MPKPKPDEVIRHEIVLGRAEREIIRDLQLSYTFNRISSPFTNLSPAGALFLSGTGLLLLDYLLDNIGLDPDWKEIITDMTPEGVKDWFETQNLVLGGIGAIIGAIIGTPFGLTGVGAVVGGAAGSGVAEGVEYAFETADEADALPAWADPTPDVKTEERKLAESFWLGLLQLRATAGIVAAQAVD
jgi:hypothetical protein